MKRENLKFTHFAKEHFADYASWFEDQQLFDALGPKPDQEWLDHVLTDPSGVQFAITLNEALVAVLGVALATSESPYHVITDIAVCPTLRKSGLGRMVVEITINDVFDKSNWKSFVMQDNPAAKEFFQKLDWNLVDPSPPENEMFEFTFFRKTV